MNWLDYREKLGIGYNDDEKKEFFFSKIFNYLDLILMEEGEEKQVLPDEYLRFCDITGTVADFSEFNGTEFNKILIELRNHKESIEDFLSYYVAFLNCQFDDEIERLMERKICKDFVIRALEESRLYSELLEDEDGVFIFPKGAEELDDALVSDVLIWLKDYPRARKTYVDALKQYSDGEYKRDAVDNLRKALEAFLQEFLNNSKNLESNKTEICRFLSQCGVDSGILGLFEPLIRMYKNINDRVAKHNDMVDKNMLEFFLYQTGVLIRMVLIVNKESDVGG